MQAQLEHHDTAHNIGDGCFAFEVVSKMNCIIIIIVYF